jgi:ribosomal protein S18 acetylase RimI-like enzyme
MPASSQQQAKFIFAMRHKYKSKRKAPKNMKWVFDEKWTKGIKFKDLPYKVRENYLLKFDEFVNESFNNIEIVECEKSRESYDFVSNYLDIIDFESYINNQNLYQVCAYENNILIGVSIFKMYDGKIHMNYGVVDANYRNVGINKKMKLKIIEIGKENNCSLITANVRESNIPSLRSLESVGFEINNKVDLRYPDGEKKIPLYLYLNKK